MTAWFRPGRPAAPAAAEPRDGAVQGAEVNLMARRRGRDFPRPVPRAAGGPRPAPAAPGSDSAGLAGTRTRTPGPLAP